MCVPVGLTTVDELKVFYVDFCSFSDQKVLFLAINDAMALASTVGRKLRHSNVSARGR